MAKAILIIAPDKFRDEELFDTKHALEDAKIETVIASKNKDTANGMMGGAVKPDIKIDEIVLDGCDALILVGGSGASVYFDDAKVQSLVKAAFDKCRVVAAICIAPSVLANAGILKGRKATCYISEADNLKEKGAIYTGNSVEIDGKVITANGPGAAKEFGKMIVFALG